MVAALLEGGADIRHCYIGGTNALQRVVMSGHRDNISTLLYHSPQIVTLTDDRGCNVLHYVIDRLDKTESLTDEDRLDQMFQRSNREANKLDKTESLTDEDRLEVMDLIFRCCNREANKKLVNGRDQESISPFVLAASIGNTEMLEKMLPFATTIEIIRAQSQAGKVADAVRSLRALQNFEMFSLNPACFGAERALSHIRVQHVLFRALLERRQGWLLSSSLGNPH